MYLCDCCKAPVGPKVSKLVHIIKRQVYSGRFDRNTEAPIMREEIAQELAICYQCEMKLEEGQPLKKVKEIGKETARRRNEMRREMKRRTKEARQKLAREYYLQGRSAKPLVVAIPKPKKNVVKDGKTLAELYAEEKGATK